MVNMQLDSNFARNNQLTHGPSPSKISEKLMHELKYSLKTYNGMLSLCKLEGLLEEEVLPLSVRRTQRLQQRKEQRTSFCVFDF